MRKIIDGRMYDTDTAEKIFERDTHGYYSRDDFHWTEEALYRKRTGEFFLYGYGGALTKYAHFNGQMSVGGEKFIPMTLEDAKKYVERYCTTGLYIELFGEVAE